MTIPIHGVFVIMQTMLECDAVSNTRDLYLQMPLSFLCVYNYYIINQCLALLTVLCAYVEVLHETVVVLKYV